MRNNDNQSNQSNFLNNNHDQKFTISGVRDDICEELNQNQIFYNELFKNTISGVRDDICEELNQNQIFNNELFKNDDEVKKKITNIKKNCSFNLSNNNGVRD